MAIAGTPALFVEGLKRVTMSAYASVTPTWNQLFKEGTMQGRQESSLNMAGIGRYQEFYSGQSPVPDQIYQGYLTTFVRRKFGKMLSFEDDDLRDDRYNKLGKPVAQQFGRAAADTIDAMCADIFNLAFDGTNQAGPDGVALCSTAHPLINPRNGFTTYANRPATDAAFSATALKAALISWSAMVTDEGEPIGTAPEKIVLPKEIRFDVAEVLNSTFIADTVARTNANSLKGLLDTAIEWRRLSSTTAWFLVGPKSDPNYGLHLLWSRKLSTDSWVEKRNDMHYFKAAFALSIGFTEPRTVWGTDGTP